MCDGEYINGPPGLNIKGLIKNIKLFNINNITGGFYPKIYIAIKDNNIPEYYKPKEYNPRDVYEHYREVDIIQYLDIDKTKNIYIGYDRFDKVLYMCVESL